MRHGLSTVGEVCRFLFKHRCFEGVDLTNLKHGEDVALVTSDASWGGFGRVPDFLLSQLWQNCAKSIQTHDRFYIREVPAKTFPFFVEVVWLEASSSSTALAASSLPTELARLARRVVTEFHGNDGGGSTGRCVVLCGDSYVQLHFPHCGVDAYRALAMRQAIADECHASCDWSCSVSSEVYGGEGGTIAWGPRMVGARHAAQCRACRGRRALQRTCVECVAMGVVEVDGPLLPLGVIAGDQGDELSPATEDVARLQREISVRASPPLHPLWTDCPTAAPPRVDVADDTGQRADANADANANANADANFNSNSNSNSTNSKRRRKASSEASGMRGADAAAAPRHFPGDLPTIARLRRGGEQVFDEDAWEAIESSLSPVHPVYTHAVVVEVVRHQHSAAAADEGGGSKEGSGSGSGSGRKRRRRPSRYTAFVAGRGSSNCLNLPPLDASRSTPGRHAHSAVYFVVQESGGISVRCLCGYPGVFCNCDAYASRCVPIGAAAHAALFGGGACRE